MEICFVTTRDYLKLLHANVVLKLEGYLSMFYYMKRFLIG